MSTTEPMPDAYVLRRVHEALGTDSRVGDFGLIVELEDCQLVIRGCVGTPERKAGVIPVVVEALAELSSPLIVRDETEITPNAPPTDEEELA